MAKCKFSLILPARTTQGELDKFLSQLKSFPETDSWELIVVDDHSEEMLAIKDQPGKILRMPGPSGAAASRNRGAAEARGEYLVFMSVFLSLPEDYLGQLERFVSKYNFDFAQHPIRTSTDLTQSHFQRYIGNQAGRVSPKKDNLPVKQSLFTAAVVPHKVFAEARGFDGEMQHYGGHEMDLIYRLEKKGHGKRVLIDTIELERTSVSSRSRTIERLRQYGKTGLPNLLNKHPELNRTVLVGEWVWWPLYQVGLTRFGEFILSGTIKLNIKLPGFIYRLYLHLVVRNAWDSR